MDMLRRIPYWAVIGLLVYMPFHIFLSQSLSVLTGGLEIWKIAKDVFLVLAVMFTICLVYYQHLSNRLFNVLVGLSALYLLFHVSLWWLNNDIYPRSAILGTIYNMRLPGLALLGYGAMLLRPGKFVFSSILKIVLIVSTVVSVLGILQYFLPKDILSHLGYSLDRGVRPAFFIDDNPALPRIMSTLREPNALGAYLLLPFTVLLLLGLRAKEYRQRLFLFGAVIVHIIAIFLTFSRSAWLGVILAALLAVWWSYWKKLKSWLTRWWPLLLVVTLLIPIVIFRQQDNHFVNSYITHSTPEDVEDLDSNDYHWLLVRQGLEGIVEQPMGHGPGTAGLVTIQNPNGAFLTENYFVQIGYEIGILGLVVFLAINVLVYLALRRQGGLGVVSLMAVFWAYAVTNMLLHTWSNEAVAVQWWLLSGVAIGMAASMTKKAPRV